MGEIEALHGYRQAWFSRSGFVAIKGVIFDSDGTLVDSENVAAGLLHRMLAERAIELSQAEVLRRFRGVQFAVFVAELSKEHPSLEGEAFMAEFRHRSLDEFRAGLAPMPGALAFVEQLDLPKCVASNGPMLKIETCLTQAGLLQHFPGRLVSAYEVRSWKPAPGLIIEAARVLGLPPDECLLIEDSLAGAEAGLAAGAQVAGFGEFDFSRFDGAANFHRTPTYDDVAVLLQRLRE
jgi:HAD superfamily hydrolase (TIGR01509 family)